MSKREFLGEFEHVVLAAILHLGNDAYGMTIRREIADRTGRDISIGALYTTLDRMENKGYLKSKRGEPTNERGGRAKKYYTVSAPGLKTFNQSREMLTNMWGELKVLGT
jgi:DNA-binding PadR family transcriptional regulator